MVYALGVLGIYCTCGFGGKANFKHVVVLSGKCKLPCCNIIFFVQDMTFCIRYL